MSQTWCKYKHRQIPVDSRLWLQSHVDKKSKEKKFSTSSDLRVSANEFKSPQFHVSSSAKCCLKVFFRLPGRKRKETVINYKFHRHWETIMNLVKENFPHTLANYLLSECVGEAQGFCRKEFANVLLNVRSSWQRLQNFFSIKSDKKSIKRTYQSFSKKCVMRVLWRNSCSQKNACGL